MTAVIQELRIENFAIVDRLELSFDGGLTVLTGETGAGKSILIGALKLLLGGRATADIVRAGSNRAVIEALVNLAGNDTTANFIREKGIELDDNEVVVRRVINKSGRSRVSVNGQLITVGMLGEMMRPLIDISGQHEHVALLDQEKHIDRVDEFGQLNGLRAAVADAHARKIGYESALASLAIDDAERARREDYLRFQLEEIENVDPQPDELEMLETERTRLVNMTKLVEGTRTSEASLYSSDGAVIEVLGEIQHRLVELSRLDEEVEPLADSVSSALAELEDLSRGLERYSVSLEYDPERLAEIDDRLDTLQRLMRKHGGNLESLLEVKERLADELDNLFHDEARQADIRAALEQTERELEAVAVRLTAARKKAAVKLEKITEENLRELAMPEAKLSIRLVPLKVVSARGAERAEILIAPNPGEAFRPLHKTASGGELSRLLLAFKQVLADVDRVGLYVFDEVDSGVGGSVADVIGRKLKMVSQKRQVLTITHLPQVAAYSDHHLFVRKTLEDGRTVSRVEALNEADVVSELGRMLGGASVTDQSITLAQEMREMANLRQRP